MRFLYTVNETLPMELIRGVPLFAEVEFVPSYFPPNTRGIIITVMLARSMRQSRWGGPYILGVNRESITVPSCRLCTNNQQSYTIPVQLYLPDDNWCHEGPIMTGWKIEAFLEQDGSEVPSFLDSLLYQPRQDTVLGFAIDEQKQILIRNRPNSMYCTKSPAPNPQHPITAIDAISKK